MNCGSPVAWTTLCQEVRRPWCPAWRGVLPTRGAPAPTSAPLAIAICALFGAPRTFDTEAAAATWRALGPLALNAAGLWRDLAYDREMLRAHLDCVRHWRGRGDQRQAAMAASELARRWTRYRRDMRRLADAVDAVRAALMPRPGQRAASRHEVAA